MKSKFFITQVHSRFPSICILIINAFILFHVTGCASNLSEHLRDGWTVPKEQVVQLRYMRVPELGLFAIHYRFFSYDPSEEAWTSWEVEPDIESSILNPTAGSVIIYNDEILKELTGKTYTEMTEEERKSLSTREDVIKKLKEKGFYDEFSAPIEKDWGVVRKRNLFTKSDRAMGSIAFGYDFKSLNHYKFLKEWSGENAKLIWNVLQKSSVYTHRDSYIKWPGPNSNTYIRWVLKESGVSYDMHPKAVGKDYMGLLGIEKTTTGTGFQIETPLIGIKLGAKDGLELHPLCLTLGFDFWPPALKTPVGRIGFSEK